MTTESTLVSHYVDAADGRVHYQEKGEGPAVILIHGGGAGAYGYSNYKKNVDPLSQRNRVIVVDLPGYGQSARRAQPDGLVVSLANAVRDVMDDAGIEQANLVGNSLGGMTSLRLTLDTPERVSSLVLMGPGGGLPMFSPFPTEGLQRMFDYYEGEGPTLEKLSRITDLLVYDRSAITQELLEERFRISTLPETLANPPLRGLMAHPKDHLWRQGVENIACPTLLVWGAEDRVIPVDAGFILQKLIPNADMHIYSKCGHWAQWERADEFNVLVDDFINA
ncbi:alpha/beta fold hydrolase [Haliea salexigens]|uniref:alpha/beta fold hydrolase n=1 Tax=Haliea salexigens TaxID=287487 RepID=UPI00047F47FD|nr:alpha/beta fold hydrolase [Haliea salexigens]